VDEEDAVVDMMAVLGMMGMVEVEDLVDTSMAEIGEQKKLQ
jgi:phage-related minor tail protein